jgi:CshA-type fibril repeat protein
VIFTRLWAIAVAVPAALILATATPAAAAGPAPNGDRLTSTGAGLRKQTVTVVVPARWRMTLNGRDPQYTDTVVVPQGFYTQDSPRKVTFTPALGFLGAAAAVTIRLTGPGGRTRTLRYTATVIRPPAPPAPDLSSAGPARTTQSVTFTIPASGGLAYLDARGHELRDLRVPQGEFMLAGASSVAAEPGRPFDPTLIGASGTVGFTPARGVTGPVPAIRYRITDAYGQSSIGRYTPTVTGYRTARGSAG